MHRLLKIFLAIVLTGTVVAVVVGILLASTYQFKFTSLSGSSQGHTRNEEKQLTPDRGGSSFTEVRDAAERKRKISEAARTATLVEAHIANEDTTQNSSDRAPSQRQDEKPETNNESLEGLGCMPGADASLSEDTAERCTPPYLCVAEKPDSAVGRCRLPDSLPKLYESCDPANAEACGPGLRCSKSTTSCEPALLLGESCDPSDKEMCLSALCGRNRSRISIKNQISISITAEEAEAKRSITEHAETGNGKDYVCQIDVTCGQPCDSTLRLCSGRCNVCGRDGLCESTSSTQNQVEGVLPTALQLLEEDLDNRATGDRDISLETGNIEDSNKQEGHQGRDVDKELLQATGEGEDKGERHKSGDLESQRCKQEEEGEAGARREQPGSRDKAESDESHYEEETSVQKFLSSASEDKKEDGEVDLEQSAESVVSTTPTSNYSDNSRAGDREHAASPAAENKRERGSSDAQGDSPGSSQKQYLQSTVLPRGRQQTVNREEDKPGQQAEGAGNIGNLQNEVSVQPIQQPERQLSSSHYSLPAENIGNLQNEVSAQPIQQPERQLSSSNYSLPAENIGNLQNEVSVQPIQQPEQQQRNSNYSFPFISAEADKHIGQTHIQRAPGTPEVERGKPQVYDVHELGHSVTYSTSSNPATSTGQPPGPTTVAKPVFSLLYGGNQQERQKTGERTNKLWPTAPETVALRPARDRSVSSTPPFNTQLQRTQRQRLQLSEVQPLRYQEQRAHSQQRAREQRPLLQHAISPVAVRQDGQQYEAQQQHDAVQVELQERGPLEEDGRQEKQRRPPQPSHQLPHIREKAGNHQEPAGLHPQNVWQLRQRQQQAGHQQPPLQAAKVLRPQQNHQRGLLDPRGQHNERLPLRHGDAEEVPILLRKQPESGPPPLHLRSQIHPLRGTAAQETLAEDKVGGHRIPPLQQTPVGLPSTAVGADARRRSDLPESFGALHRAVNLAMQRYVDLLHAVPAAE